MADTPDDLSINYFEEGVQTVKELDKKILSKGAWTTIIFKHQDWDRTKEQFGPIKFSIRRYQKRNGVYMQRSKFNISSIDQAQQIIEVLTQWLAQEPTES